MNTVTINGKSYTSTSGNIVVQGNRVIVDGKDITPDAKEIHVHVQGAVQNLSVDACISLQVDGEVGELTTQSGDVRCGDVKGSVSTMSGDVHCESVAGSVKTMSGDVYGL